MNRRYIIFADDDADDLELITGYFREYNPSVPVMEFRDGNEVIGYLDEVASTGQVPLLVVLDVNMPRLNGIDTLATIRKHPLLQYVPVVMYTTSANEKEESFCKNLGASWACKPSSLEGVRQTAKVLAEFCQLQYY